MKTANYSWPFTVVRDMLQCNAGQEKSALIAWANDSDIDERARAVEAAFGVTRDKWDRLQAEAPATIKYPTWAYALAILAEERRLHTLELEEME